MPTSTASGTVHANPPNEECAASATAWKEFTSPITPSSSVATATALTAVTSRAVSARLRGSVRTPSLLAAAWS